MSKKEKLLDKIRQNARNVSLEEFESLINTYGYIEQGSKHPKAIFGEITLPYKKENPVKLCYVLELIEIIDRISK